MRSIIIIKHYALTWCFAFVIAGCWGGGPSAGIDGSGEPPKIITGPINGFGSVIVNGVRYTTDNAEIYLGNELTQESELNVGNYVTVIGTQDTDGTHGVAHSVHYQPNFTGPISSINKSEGTAVVLQQTVVLNNDTTFDRTISPRDISGLTIGDKFEVSGHRDSNSPLIATRTKRVSE